MQTFYIVFSKIQHDTECEKAEADPLNYGYNPVLPAEWTGAMCSEVSFQGHDALPGIELMILQS